MSQRLNTVKDKAKKVYLLEVRPERSHRTSILNKIHILRGVPLYSLCSFFNTNSFQPWTHSMQLNLRLINISGKYLDFDLIDSLGAFWLETGIDRITSANQLDLHENNF